MPLPEKLDSILNAQLPMWAIGIIVLGSSALSIVAGPPLLAVVSEERSDKLVKTHCAAPLAALELQLANAYGVAIRDLNIDNSIRLQALEKINMDLVMRTAALERQVCVLAAQRLGSDTDKCFAVGN